MKRIWVILGVVVCCVAAVCIWLLMSKEEMQPLPLPNGNQIQKYRGIYLSCSDGEKGGNLLMTPEQQEELLQMLTKAKAQPEQAWSAEKVKLPAYEIYLTYNDDLGQFRGRRAVYTNGYLVYEDGSAYRVKLGLGQFVNKHKLLEQYERDYPLYGLECFYWLAWGENGWNSKYLPLAEEPKGQTGVTIELNEWTNETITYTVDAEYGWSMGNGSFHLHVKLDDQWHKVPPLPGCGLDTLQLITGGPGVYEETVHYAWKYGTLPPGHYRFEIGDLSFEHTVE